MKTATIQQINQQLFASHDSFINQPKHGKCKLVAVHGLDQSTAKQYEGYNDCTLVSLKPLSGDTVIKVMVDNDALFDITPSK